MSNLWLSVMLEMKEYRDVWLRLERFLRELSEVLDVFFYIYKGEFEHIISNVFTNFIKTYVLEICLKKHGINSQVQNRLDFFST